MVEKKIIRAREPWPWWRWVLLGLISLGLTLSGYLSWHYLAGGQVIGCGIGSSCDDVLSSRWSSVAGTVPVSGLAAGAYLAMLVASFSLGPSTEVAVRRLAWGAMLVLAGATAGSAIWFIIVQKWMIGSFCRYCMATHITGLVLATLVFWRAPRQFDEGSSRKPKDRFRTIGMGGAGFALAGALAVCQWTVVPRAVYRAGESQQDFSAFDTHNVPIVGSPDAQYVVVMLFDYKCPHCQQIHFMLNEVVRRYQGKLAFVLCPTPMRRECNPYIPRDVDEFKNSCELAKIGMAVWVAKHEAFSEFDQWMFSHETGDRWQARTPEAATAKAIELVGKQKFETALTDPWVERYLKTTVEIYGNNGGGAIPKMVFGSHWVTPKPVDADDLLLILRGSLQVPAP